MRIQPRKSSAYRAAPVFLVHGGQAARYDVRMKDAIPLAVSVVTLIASSAWAQTCPSDLASVAPSPAQLAKMCPDEKAFAQPADPEDTGNRLFCAYGFGHMPAMPSLPQARMRVGSNAGTTLADVQKQTDPKAAATRVAQGMSADFKATVTKMPWKNVEAYRVDMTLAGMQKAGEAVYVKSSKGVVSVLLKAGNAIPACLEKVAEFVAHH